jgi:hypothetical protein
MKTSKLFQHVSHFMKTPGVFLSATRYVGGAWKTVEYEIMNNKIKNFQLVCILHHHIQQLNRNEKFVFQHCATQRNYEVYALAPNKFLDLWDKHLYTI